MTTKYTPDDIIRILKIDMPDNMPASQQISYYMHKLKIWQWHLEWQIRPKSRISPPVPIRSKEDQDIFIENIRMLIRSVKFEIAKLKSIPNDNIR